MSNPRDHASHPLPAAPTTSATVGRAGDALVFHGAMDRAAVASLWRQAQPLREGVQRLDLREVSRIDSAGLALLAELAGGSAGDGPVPAGMDVVGTPAGLDELRAAYRLDARLAFAR